MRTKSRPPPLARQNLSANFDEVKRRFIRQNRELAKNNSSQSLRIRSLEIEVSRLLQTNLELREELLRARNAEQDARRQSNKEGVRGFKEEMMAKLRELSGIVEGIEEPKDEKADEAAEREERRMSVLSQMEFRERQSLAELMRDCQMPTIDENKMHPRRTLEAAEIKAIRLSDGSSNGSPDLGPPPVARFECQDPIKFDAQDAAEPQEAETEKIVDVEPETTPQEEDLPASLSINLETRRKRRDTQPKLELRRHSILPPPSPTSSEEATAPSLRTGAKRKLADRDLDKPTRTPGKTDFTFNRKTSAEPTKPSDETPEEAEPQPETVEISAPVPTSARKVLGDKSVNMSPRKTAAGLDKPVNEDLKKPAQPKFGAAKDRTTSRRSRVSVVPPPEPETVVTVSTIELPAEPALHTPAPADIFSPTPEPSTASNERTATPPPMKLSNPSMEAARPSRRARSAVNYAEPSLGAKMRRQEKGMMDAVTGLQHHRLAMSVSAEKKARSSKVVVKDEPQDEDAWKSLPAVDATALSAARSRAASPLEMKGNGASSMDAIARPQTTEDSTSEPRAAVPAPTQPSRQRARPSIQDKTSLPDTAGAELDDAAKKLKELDLYDFKDSSSSSPASTISTDSTTKPSAPAPRSHRRHSSIPRDALRTSGDSERSRPAGRTTSATSAASRRRSMMT
ncbi:hypothetical protein MBLNU13_g07706t1 [Cladosporium sp. NU13]